MPFSSIGSILPTIDEFLAHWDLVNASPAGVLTLLGGYTRAMLQGDRTKMALAITNVENLDNASQTAAGTRDLLRAPQGERIRQFGATVRGLLPGTRFIRALPRVPGLSGAQGIWIRRMDDMNNLWATINANVPPVAGFVPPLLLAGGYTLATFGTDSAALSAGFTGVTTARQNATVGREFRDDLIPPVRGRLKQYRQAVQGRYPAGDALIDSLPALTPPPGSTPNPVSLSGSWDLVTSEGVLIWTASANPNLDHYSIRTHPGPNYKAAEEEFVANVNPPILEFRTLVGLAAPGSTALFKVYVVTTTQNARGSNSVRITRP